MTEFWVDPGNLEELAGKSWRRRERLAEGREALAKVPRGAAGTRSGGARDDFVVGKWGR